MYVNECAPQKNQQILKLCKHIPKHSCDTAQSHPLIFTPTTDTHFHIMARGQKNKSLTSHQQSATGRHKNAKSMTSQAVPLDENIIPAAIPPRPKPRPRPRLTGHKSANIGDEKGESEADAAHALISLQNCTNIVLNSPPTHRYLVWPVTVLHFMRTRISMRWRKMWVSPPGTWTVKWKKKVKLKLMN